MPNFQAWDGALAQLRLLLAARGDEARRAAEGYANAYETDRAAMVFDVVASRQRRYETRVQTLVRGFKETAASESLNRMALTDEEPVRGLRRGEWGTMRLTAAGLVRFGADTGLAADDDVVRSWARATETFRHFHTLDPYVGSVHGIGSALFAYLRMRSGADTLKADSRLRQKLDKLGLSVTGELPLLLLGERLADELNVPRLVFDQLLWWAP